MLNTLARRDEETGRHKRGFSLVELAAVVAVIAILAAIAIPAFLIFQRNSRGGTMDATGNGFQRSMLALAQQQNRTANLGDFIGGAYGELTTEDAQQVAIYALGEDGPNTIGTGLAGATAANPVKGDRYNVLVIVQAIGDNARAGCLFLPPRTATGEAPVYVRHGSAYEGDTIDWGDADASNDVVQGVVADIEAPLCRSTSPGSLSNLDAEAEGVFLAVGETDHSGTAFGEATFRTTLGGARIVFDDAQNQRDYAEFAE